MRNFSSALPGCWRLAIVVSACFVALSNGSAFAIDGTMGIVTAETGKIVDGDKVLAEVTKGTRLWVFKISDDKNWADVKLPGQEGHGWINTANVKDLEIREADLKKLAQIGADAAAMKNHDDYKIFKLSFNQHLAYCEKTLGADHPYFIQFILNVADQARDYDDHQLSEQLLQRALKTSREVLGTNSATTSYILTSYFLLYSASGDYSKALDNLQESLKISQQVDGADSFSVAVLLGNLGNHLMHQGDYVQAKKNLNMALELYKKHSEDPSDYASTARINLGDVAIEQGDYRNARTNYEAALKFYREQTDQEFLNLPYALQKLAYVNYLEGNIPQAKQLIAEALQLRRKRHGEQHSWVADSLIIQSHLALHSADYPSATRDYEQALAIYRKNYGNEHASVAEAIQCLGNVAMRQGKYDAAWQKYNDALGIQRRIYGNDHPKTIALLSKIAKLATFEQEYDVAARQWDSLRRIQQRYAQYLLPNMTAEEQLKFLDNNFLPDWLLGMSLGPSHAADPSLVNLTSGWLINGKAIAQESLAARELFMRDSAHPVWGSLAKEVQDIRTQLAAQTLAAVKPEQAAAQQAALTRLIAEEYRLSQKLTEATGQPAITREWIEPGELRRALRPTASYVDFVRLPVVDSNISSPLHEKPQLRYYAWIIPPHRQGNIAVIDLGDASVIDRGIEQARSSVADASNAQGTVRKDGEAAAAAKTAKSLQAVAKLVLQPLLPHLKDTQELILSPDGALWLLPWGALPVADNKCLLEQCSIRYLLSGRDLVKKAGLSKLDTTTSAIVVNPDYNLNGSAAKAAIQKILPATKLNEIVVHGETSRSSLPRVAALPFTALEGAAAKPSLEQLTKSTPVFYEQEQALEAVVKKFQRPKHLLLSTHGFFLPDQEVKLRDDKLQLASSATRSLPALTTDGKPVENPLLRCGLLFAGCNAPRTIGLDDGILTGLEIVGMDLRGTELVVLSACETGIGKVRNGEGVAGLRQAFQLAGAQSVVSTLWQVPDRDSAIIMQDFFTNLAAGQNKADALRNAQLKRIEARKEKSGAAHPFFWAAWTVTGN